MNAQRKRACWCHAGGVRMSPRRGERTNRSHAQSAKQSIVCIRKSMRVSAGMHTYADPLSPAHAPCASNTIVSLGRTTAGNLIAERAGRVNPMPAAVSLRSVDVNSYISANATNTSTKPPIDPHNPCRLSPSPLVMSVRPLSQILAGADATCGIPHSRLSHRGIRASPGHETEQTRWSYGRIVRSSL